MGKREARGNSRGDHQMLGGTHEKGEPARHDNIADFVEDVGGKVTAGRTLSPTSLTVRVGVSPTSVDFSTNCLQQHPR